MSYKINNSTHTKQTQKCLVAHLYKIGSKLVSSPIDYPPPSKKIQYEINKERIISYKTNEKHICFR